MKVRETSICNDRQSMVVLDGRGADIKNKREREREEEHQTTNGARFFSLLRWRSPPF